MAKSRSDVELVISAENKAKSTLEDFQKAIDGLSKAQKTFASSMLGTADSADDLKKKISQLNSVQNELSSRGKAIKAYREQADVMRKVAKEMFKYKEGLKNTRAQLEATTTPSKELKQVYAQQATSVARLKREYARLPTGLRQTQAALRDNKITLRELNSEELKLKATQKAVTAGITSQTNALEKLSSSSRRAGGNIKKIGGDSRKSLGFMQRLRGETLALIATFGGLYAAGRGVASVFEASRQVAAAKARLGVAFDGNDSDIANEMARIRTEADRLGVNFEALREEYTKFIPSAKRTGLTLEESRHIFDAVTESAVVNRASMEDLGGIYKAVTQIIGKGQVQAEELRGQLGDRLVGAVIDYANALGVTTAELNKMLEQGEVTSSSLIEFATELKSVYGDELADAVEQPVAQLARLQNAVADIKIALAESGFVGELGNAMKEVAKELKDPATIAGAESLGRTLGEIVKVLVVLVKNGDKVIAVAKAFLALALANKVIAIGVGAATTAKQIGGLNLALGLLGKRALFLAGPAGILAGLAWLMYDIVKASGSASTSIEKFSQKLLGLKKAGTAQDKAALQSIVTEADDAIREMEGRLEKLQNYKGRSSRNKGGAIQGIKDQIAAYREGRNEAKKALDAFVEVQAAIEGGGEGKAGGVQGRFVGKLGAQYRKLFITLSSEFVKLNEKAAKKEADTLEERLAAIDLGYQDLFGKIDKTEAAMRARLAKLQDVFGRDNLSDDVRKVIAIDIQNMEDMLRQLEAGRGTANRSRLADRAKEIEIFTRKRITEELKISDFVTATQKSLAENEAATLQQRLTFIDQQIDERLAKIALLENASPEVKSAGSDEIEGLREQLKLREELSYSQERLNELLELQKQQVEVIQISTNDEWEKKRAVKEVNDEILPQLDAMALKALVMARALGDKQAIQNLELILAQIKRMNKELGAGAVAIHRMFSTGLTTAISDTVRGVESAGAAFKKFAANFLQRLGEMILQQQIFNLLQAAANSTGYGGVISLVGAGVQHSGGLAGASSNPTRSVPAYAFAGAPRFHGGGMPGIKSNEVPTILERGEEVLTADDPRHQANGGGAQQGEVTIVNSFDTESVVAQGIATPAGERAILNVIRANKNTLKGL